jgi:hypothetical protein
MRVRRRYLALPVLLVVLAAVLMVHFNTATPGSSRIVASSPSPYCRSGNPLPQFNPLRVRLLSRCEAASGVVKLVTTQYDSARRIDVSLDSLYVKLLDVGNVNYQNGLLVLEVAPPDQATITISSVGQHINFVGPLVYDTVNHWNAIYPVWSITSS